MSRSLGQKNLCAGFYIPLHFIELSVDEGRIIEQGTPEQIFDAPQEERTRRFVSQVYK
jgi:ABC-type histidine transport system ATPase subunit